MPGVTEQEVARIMAHFQTSQAGGRCDHCGFEWSMPVAEAGELLRTSPDRVSGVIAQRWAEVREQRDPPLWSPSAYVWHMGDAIGIWAERFVAMHEEPDSALAGFDQDLLAEVRGYDRLSPAAALWAYRKRIDEFMETSALHDPDKQFQHPDFGAWSIGGVIKWMAHDMVHHEEDIARQLQPPSSRQ